MPATTTTTPDRYTRQGEHGPEFRFELEYTTTGSGDPALRWRCWARDLEHAIERFCEGPDAHDFTILRGARMSEKPRDRWTWRKIAHDVE